MTEIDCNWGIIGAGEVCEEKGGPPLYRVEGCRLIGVSRRDRLAGEDYARRHGPSRYFESIGVLLADEAINCIYVASPPTLHLAHTVVAAEAGKHVLCEKPMAMDTVECTRMVEVCGRHGVTLAVAYYRRGYPSILRARQLLADGAIGEPRSIWLNTKFPISHRLDLVQYFCGDITSVRIQVSDTGQPDLLATTASGTALRTSLGLEESARTEQVLLEGTDGSLFIDDLKGGSLILESKGGQRRERFAALSATHWGIVENFRDHLRHGTSLACDGLIGRKTSVVLDHVSNLHESGDAVDVDHENPPKYDAEQGKAFGLLL